MMCSGVSAMKSLASNLNGLFAVVKPTGITSAGVVNQLKRILTKEHKKQLQEYSNHHTRSGKVGAPYKKLRIGHGGTLDSNASGVLVIGVGLGTKLLASQLKGNKRYRAVGCLGTSTDTQDVLGKITQRSPADHVTLNLITSSLQRYVGNIMQIPPLYSALKVGGVRMSDLAVRGEPIAPKPARPVTVHSLECVQFSPPYFTLDIHCGGGFYVRQLIQDLGQDMGTNAHLAELTRTQQGPFTLAKHALAEDKWTLEHICEAVQEFTEIAELENLIKPP
ncbi:probable tRNA pseudouridine synthase 1 [Patiria miniata]|uniref:tRNA pseudouridine(55) synthase n=1 Tax=Patiria miniata TaxID=46514 RepID=A0A914B2B5_PATMI|nr:probable tRNA pseudouridine synthase 1 [Patiria miniata]